MKHNYFLYISISLSQEKVTQKTSSIKRFLIQNGFTLIKSERDEDWLDLSINKTDSRVKIEQNLTELLHRAVQENLKIDFLVKKQEFLLKLPTSVFEFKDVILQGVNTPFELKIENNNQLILAFCNQDDMEKADEIITSVIRKLNAHLTQSITMDSEEIIVTEGNNYSNEYNSHYITNKKRSIC